MSKLAAIDVAIRHQLDSDDKGMAHYSRIMGDAATDITGTSEAGYGYDCDGIQRFLLNVANRLKCDTPALLFDWRSLDPSMCLQSNLITLISQIESVTEIPCF